MRRILIMVALFILALAGNTVFAESFELNLYIQGLEHSAPPMIFNETIIFSYEALSTVSIVAARFGHENFSVLHVFRKNEYNVFILTLPAPSRTTTIKYRLMIDGVWTSDPANPLHERDERGTILSVFHFESTATIPVESPKLLANGYVEFSLQTITGSNVSIAGDFNTFDPFTQYLTEEEPGLYRIRLKLIPGTHYYYFIVDGLPLVDPRNAATVENKRGQRYSQVIVP